MYSSAQPALVVCPAAFCHIQGSRLLEVPARSELDIASTESLLAAFENLFNFIVLNFWAALSHTVHVCLYSNLGQIRIMLLWRTARLHLLTLSADIDIQDRYI